MLNELITTDIYRFLMVFVRLGAALMFVPGIGGQRVPNRMQLVLALAISFVLLPVLGGKLPPMPRQVGDLVLMIVGEATVGVFMGMTMQFAIAALHVAGTVMGFQVGLTNAFSFDAVAEQQSSLLTSFLTNVALVVIFATDLHHLMLRAVVDTYELFPVGRGLPLGDLSDALAQALSKAFVLGIKLSAPLVAFGIIFYSGMGLLSRMVPQMQVFFVALPIQMIAGLWMLMIAMPLIFLLFLRHFEDALLPFVVPG